MLRFISILLVLATFPFAYAQPKKVEKDENADKVEALKIQFITNELDLTDKEAEAFWPVYNNMSDDLQSSRKEQRELNKKLRDNFEVMSDEEVEKTTKALLDNEIKQAQIKKEYTEKIAGIIGYRKATKLLSAEQRFKRELLQRLNRPENEGTNKIPENESDN